MQSKNGRNSYRTAGPTNPSMDLPDLKRTPHKSSRPQEATPMLPKASPKSLRPAKPFRMPPRSAGASPTRAQEQRAASEDRLQQLNVLDRDLPLVGEEVGCGGSVYGDRKTLVCDQGCVAGGPALTTVRRVPRPHTPDHTTEMSGLTITRLLQPTPPPSRQEPATALRSTATEVARNRRRAPSAR